MSLIDALLKWPARAISGGTFSGSQMMHRLMNTVHLQTFIIEITVIELRQLRIDRSVLPTIKIGQRR